MDTKIFISEIKVLSSLKNNESNFKTKRAIKRQQRKITKMIKAAAKDQANIAYKQTYDLYQEFVNANL